MKNGFKVNNKITSNFVCPHRHQKTYLISSGRQKPVIISISYTGLTLTLTNTDFRTAYEHVLILSYVVRVI